MKLEDVWSVRNCHKLQFCGGDASLRFFSLQETTGHDDFDDAVLPTRSSCLGPVIVQAFYEFGGRRQSVGVTSPNSGVRPYLSL